MAIVQVIGGLWIPSPLPWVNLGSFTNEIIDASGEMVAYIIRVPKTGTLNKFEFRVGTATIQLPANGLKCSFQSVDLSTGFPSGTADQYRTLMGIAGDSWMTPGLMTSDGTDGGGKRSVVRGELLACVIEFASFTVLDSVNISEINLTTNMISGNPPYAALFTSAWAKRRMGPIVALQYDDETYTPIVGDALPISAMASTSFNSSSSPDEVGLSFTVPAPMLISGAWFIADLDGNVDVTLYDIYGGQALTSISLDKDVRSGTGVLHNIAHFPRDVRLEANNPYRIAIKPTTATNIALHYFDTASESLMDAVPGGRTWIYTFQTDGGGFTDFIPGPHLRRPWMGLMFSGVDHDISGGSGGLGWEGIP